MANTDPKQTQTKPNTDTPQIMCLIIKLYSCVFIRWIQSLAEMCDTWLSSAMAEHVRRARYAFVASIVAGLVQKPLIKFAWDIQALQKHLQRLHQHTSTCGRGAALLGGTAILLRQVFATKGQEVVADVAISLAVAGKIWDKASLGKLCGTLDMLEPCDRQKRKSRMSQWTGPSWIRGCLSTPSALQRFQKASALLGAFLTSTVVEPGALHTLCTALKAPCAKMPGVGNYSVPHLVRACCIARAFIRGDRLEVALPADAEAWQKDLRDMHKERTKPNFDLLGVTSFADALVMLGSMRELARRVWSSSVARNYASISLIDLPCSACEFGGVIGSIMSIHGCGQEHAIHWLLRHLSGRLEDLKAMGQHSKKETGSLCGRGDGLDRQCSGSVTRRWLLQNPGVPSFNMEHVFSRGGGDDMFGLVPIICPSCSEIMPPRSRGRKQRTCDECYRAHVRAVDAERQVRRRRSD